MFSTIKTDKSQECLCVKLLIKFVDADETFECTHLYEAVLLVEDEVKAVRKRQVSNILVGLPLAFVTLRDLARQLSYRTSVKHKLIF